MAIVTNSTANASTTRGVIGGYFFSVKVTNAEAQALALALKDLSKKPAEVLPEGAVNLGYIAEDGINFSESKDTSTINDMNGDPIDTSTSNRSETVAVTLAEVKEDSLKEAYGHGNVKDSNGVIVAAHNNEERESRFYAAFLVLKNKRRWNVIVPDGKVTELGDRTANSTSLLGYPITISANDFTWTDDDGSEMKGTVFDFIESTETEAGGDPAEGDDDEFGQYLDGE